MPTQLVSQLKSGNIPTGLYAIGTRVIAAAVSFAGGILILVLFEPGRIGVFLSFTSLAGFSAIADLGLSYSFLLAVSSRRPDETTPLAWAAFTSMVPTVIATGIILFLGGSLFMLQGGVTAERWLWPWIAYCTISSLHVTLTLGLSYVEGTGRRHAAWKANFWIEVAGGIAFLAAVGTGLELWALSGSALVRSALIAFAFARQFTLPTRPVAGRAFHLWRRELWPMQWKMLVNNLVGLATTRLLTPGLLATRGEVAAGQTGLVLSLSLMAVTATSVWPVSQTALYSDLYHRGAHRDFVSTFRRTAIASTALSVGFAIAGGALCEAVRFYSQHMSARLPDSVVIWSIMAVAPISHLVNCFAIAFRSQRVDPAVLPNFILGVLCLPVLWIAARQGLTLFAVTYLAVAVIFLALYWLVFQRQMRALRRS